MGITRDGNGRYYWVKRIPKEFAGLVVGKNGKPVQQVRECLHTADLAVAKRKAPQVEAAKLAEWESMLAGNDADARRYYIAARDLAKARGFSYRQAADLAQGNLSDLVGRALSLTDDQGNPEPPEVADAVLGLVPEAMPDLAEVLDEFFKLTTDRHVNKSESQIKRWRARRERAVAHFLEATVDEREDGIRPAPPINRIDRAMALKFRDWCQARVNEGQAVDTQNKDLGALSDIFTTWCSLTDNPLENPFKGLRLKGRDLSNRATYSRDFIRDTILAPDALAGLNDEARDVLLVLINTGIRPSELLNARPDDLRLDHKVPHLDICEYRGRELKQAHTARKIPLLGVSLDAAQRIADRGGIQRYAFKGDQFSAVVNKFMLSKGMRPTKAHTVYSIRHSVEDALQETGADDRIRADILGQKYDRPSYGTGGGLEGRKRALSGIAL